MSKILLCSGYKQSGKDTLANYLVKNYSIKKEAFADILKDMVAKEYKIPRHWFDDQNLKEKPLLQYPVKPQDQFSLQLSEMLYKEFKTEDNMTPSDYYIDDSNTFYGVLGRCGTRQLYWTPRALCILKGSTNRSVNSNYWVDSIINNIKTELKFDTISLQLEFSISEFKDNLINTTTYNTFVISDWRYKSEYNQLKQIFGNDLITIRIERWDNINSEDASERDLDDFSFDITIKNKGTLEEYYNNIDRLVKEIL